jgi:serine/threonine protein kinase
VFLFPASCYSEEGIKSFLDEGLIMKEFDHPNVLNLRGICFGENDLPMILLPFMANGDLLSYIREGNNLIIVKELLVFALGIANGENIELKILKNFKFYLKIHQIKVWITCRNKSTFIEIWPQEIAFWIRNYLSELETLDFLVIFMKKIIIGLKIMTANYR